MVSDGLVGTRTTTQVKPARNEQTLEGYLTRAFDARPTKARCIEHNEKAIMPCCLRKKDEGIRNKDERA